MFIGLDVMPRTTDRSFSVVRLYGCASSNEDGQYAIDERHIARSPDDTRLMKMKSESQ
jgi:hypothetical protein